MKNNREAPDPDQLPFPMRRVDIQGGREEADIVPADKKMEISPALAKICPDFMGWPERWMGDEADLAYGRGLLAEMSPFAGHLAASQLSAGTIRRHLSNLWMLGGELIREVSLNEKYDIIAPAALLAKAVDGGEGPLCCDLVESEQQSFDATCRKLDAFLKASGNAR